MIKVLEHGTKKVTCPNCKAKLQYEQEDILMDSITCPDCKQRIYVGSRFKDTSVDTRFEDTSMDDLSLGDLDI